MRIKINIHYNVCFCIAKFSNYMYALKYSFVKKYYLKTNKITEYVKICIINILYFSCSAVKTMSSLLSN